MHCFIKFSIILLLLSSSQIFTAAFASATANYSYPLENPYAATILGTPKEFKAELPKYNRIPYKEYTLEIPDAREISDVFWYIKIVNGDK